jgi:hypothetical protein
VGMNRRKFLGTLAIAPLGFAFKNPFSGLFKQWFCKHEYTQPDPLYSVCVKCYKRFPWVSYRVKYTTTLTPSSTFRLRKIDVQTTVS